MSSDRGNRSWDDDSSDCISRSSPSLYCSCRSCVLAIIEGSARRTFYLKRFDDTGSTRSVAWDPEPQGPRPITGTPGCDCGCEKCVDRRILGKKPFHLKSYDNTSGVEDDDCGESTDCLRLCLRCRFPGQASDLLEVLRNSSLDPSDTLDTHCQRMYPDPDCTECAARQAKNDFFRCPCNACAPEVHYCWDWGEEDELQLACDTHPEPNTPTSDKVYDEIALLPNMSGVAYNRCSPKALKHLVNRRGLEDPFPTGVTFSYFYIFALRSADQALRFRFSDLPPEMRNQIYGDTLDTEGTYCCPQILATSRAIHNEATGILYANNSLRCYFEMAYDYLTDDENFSDYSFSFGCQDDWYHHNTYTDAGGDIIFDDMVCDLPDDSKLRKIGTLDISISVISPGDFNFHKDDHFRMRGVMQNSLLVFASSLTDNNRLKKLNIILENDCTPRGDELTNWAEAILFPLRRLRGIKEVTISSGADKVDGYIRDETDQDRFPSIAKAICREIKSDQPSFNTWKEILRVQARRDRYMDLICNNKLEDFGGRWATFDKLLHLYALPPALPKPSEALLVDESHKKEVLASLADLEGLLDELGPVELLVSRLENMA